MAFENDEMKNLQKLVKSSLIEINKLKLELVKVKNENSSLKNNDDLAKLKFKHDGDLSNLKLEHEGLLAKLKSKHVEDLKNKEDEIDSLKIKLNTISENTQSEIIDLKKSFNEQLSKKDSKINGLYDDITDFKKKLSETGDQLESKSYLVLSQKNEIEKLSNQIVDLKKLNESLIKMKESLEVDFNNFKNLELDEVNTKLKNALNEVSDKETKIQSISNDLKISENELTSLRREFEEYKHNVSKTEVKLAAALNSVEEKTTEMEKLNLKIESQREIITDLKTNLVNKDSLIALQREIDNKDLAIKEKDVQIKTLKEQSVSKEDFNQVQNELSKKELQIKRLNEVKDLFFELSDKEPVTSILDEDIVNNVSDDDSYLLELNEIKKDLEEAKENNLKLQSIDASTSSNDELNTLKKEIEGYKSSIEELEKIKVIYEKLTAPQLKDLTSIQSQIYQLLPDEPMDTLAIKDYMNEVAFENLTFGNAKNILKSLEKKGYVEGSVNDQDITFWKKLVKEE